MGKMSKEQKELLKVLAKITIFKEATKQDLKKTEETTLPPSKSETSGVERKKMPIKGYDNMYCSKGNN